MSWDQYAALVAFNMAFLGVGLWGGYRYGFIRGRENGLRRGAEITAHLTSRCGPEVQAMMVAEARKFDKELERAINQ